MTKSCHLFDFSSQKIDSCTLVYTFKTDHYAFGDSSVYKVANGFYGGNSCSMEKLIIPCKYKGYPVTEIGRSAIQDAYNLKFLIILAPITKIYLDGIRNLYLQKLVLPPTLTTIESMRIYHFTRIQRIIFPYGTKLNSIGNLFLGALYSSAVSVYFCGSSYDATASNPFGASSSAKITIVVPENGPSTFFGRKTTILHSSDSNICYWPYKFDQQCKSNLHKCIMNNNFLISIVKTVS